MSSRPRADEEEPEGDLTVRHLLSVPSLHLRLLAGPDQVDLPLRWAHPTELVDPRPYLSGQELVLTVGTSLQEPDHCREFVAHLLEAGVSALGYGIGDVSAEVPEDLVEECRTHDLTLLEVPHGVPFQSITQLLAERRAEARAARGRRVQQLVVRLLDAIALDRPMADLLAIIDDDMDGRASFHDGVVEWEPVEESDVRPGSDILQHLARVLAVRQHEEDSDLARRRAEVGRLVQLVGQGRADAEVLHHPLAAAGVPTEAPLVVTAWPPRVAELLAPRCPSCLVAEFEDVTVTIGTDADLALQVATELALPCGIAEPVPMADLRRAVPPALASLRLARTRGTPMSFRDLTTFEGLLEQQPSERVAAFTEKLIRPLAEHDRDHGGALVQTLRTLLDADGSVNATAQALFLHPNSVRHRLKRVHELTGADPRRFQDRVALAIGLWAWEHRTGPRR